MDMGMPSQILYVPRACVRVYVCTIATYRLKYKEVSTALTPVLCASLNTKWSEVCINQEMNLRMKLYGQDFELWLNLKVYKHLEKLRKENRKLAYT